MKTIKNNKIIILKSILVMFVALLLTLMLLVLSNNKVHAETQIRVSDKIKVKVYPVSYFTNTSSAGADYKNYLQSVYFFIDEEYNDRLITEITANWDKYTVEDALVFDNEVCRFISYAVRTFGVVKRPREGMTVYQGFQNNKSYFKQFLEAENKKLSIGNDKAIEEIEKNGYVKIEDYDDEKYEYKTHSFVYTKSDLNNLYLTPEECLNAKYLDSVLKNHQPHYNQPIRNPEDNGAIELKSFDDNHNWFQKFLKFGFDMPIYEENYKQHKFIEVINDDKLVGTNAEISKRIGIQERQIPKFLEDYNNNKNKRCYMFRFGTGTVRVSSINNDEYKFYNSSRGKSYLNTQFKNVKKVTFDVYKNFDIIELEMSKLIDKDIPEETKPNPDPKPGESGEIGNIDPNTPPEKHDVEQEGGPIDVTPGIDGEVHDKHFLGVDWTNAFDEFKKGIKNVFNGRVKNFFNNTKFGRILKYIFIFIASLFALFILSFLFKLILPIFKFNNYVKDRRSKKRYEK